MIVKMRKYSFLVYHKVYLEFLEKIREIGVLHIIEKAEGVSDNEELSKQMQLKIKLNALLRRLKNELPKGSEIRAVDLNSDGAKLLEEIEAKYSSLELQNQKLQLLDREAERMEVWGAFSQNRLNDLYKSNIELNFYCCNIRKFDQEWEVLYNAFEIDTIGTLRYFVTVTKPGTTIDIDADPIKLNDKNSLELRSEIEECKREIVEIKQEIQNFTIEHFNNIKLFNEQISGKIDFTKVILNTTIEVDDRIMLLEGWCPEESTQALNEYLEASEVYYESVEPVEEDKVPIKLKNNKFTRLYEMIGELYDLPNYNEIDLTPFFAPFFLLFFGMCVGDMAYGMLLVAGAIYLRIKASPAMKPVFSLAIWMGMSTIVLGFFSGTFFGFSLMDVNIPWIEKFKAYMLDSNKIFYASLIIGAVQILFGMIIKTVGSIIRFGWAAALSSIGWLLIILGMGGTYAASLTMDIEPHIIQYLYYGFGGVGAVLVFILNNVKRNPLINVGAGLWDAYNMATGILGDLLSYIRLFALGICSGVMGFVFNDLAIKMSGDIPVLNILIMILIMAFGHGINIFMAVLGAFVHPMRLTFVEFYKNAGFEGGGKKYKPFKQV